MSTLRVSVTRATSTGLEHGIRTASAAETLA
jgi:hypothetical protein